MFAAASGYALKPSPELALTHVSWWKFAQKSLKWRILHPLSGGTFLSCTFCVSIKLGWKQTSYLLSKVFALWNGEQLQPLACHPLLSVQLRMPRQCILYHSRPEWSLTLAFKTGEKSLISLGWWWSVLSFGALLHFLSVLTMLCALFLAQCYDPFKGKTCHDFLKSYYDHHKGAMKA